VHILNRSGNESLFKPVPEIGIDTQPGIVLMSGFATEGTEWLRMAVTLMHEIQELKTVTILDHPSSAPSAVHRHPDRPFNTDSFGASGRVIAGIIQKLMESGKIHGKQTAVALSTGCPVVLEANAADPDLFDRLILIAPAAMQDRTVPEMERGAASGSIEYLRRYFSDIRSEWAFRFHTQLNTAGRSNPNPFAQLIAATKATRHLFSSDDVPNEGEHLRNRTSPAVIIGDLFHTFPRHHLWKRMTRGSKAGHLAFEVTAGLIGRKTGFWQHFTGMWGDSTEGPHVPIATKQYADDLSLIARDCTGHARQRITDRQSITVILGENDTAVPPHGFLTDRDLDEIDSCSDSDARSELMIGRIIERVKDKFPNSGSTRVLIAGNGSPSGHVELKTETELYGFLIARLISQELPDRKYPVS
jgi:pimeloyl-ACP methyl ester carboxylesterase